MVWVTDPTSLIFLWVNSGAFHLGDQGAEKEGGVLEEKRRDIKVRNSTTAQRLGSPHQPLAPQLYSHLVLGPL